MVPFPTSKIQETFDRGDQGEQLSFWIKLQNPLLESIGSLEFFSFPRVFFRKMVGKVNFPWITRKPWEDSFPLRFCVVWKLILSLGFKLISKGN
jgi:hypothetical protein